MNIEYDLYLAAARFGPQPSHVLFWPTPLRDSILKHPPADYPQIRQELCSIAYWQWKQPPSPLHSDSWVFLERHLEWELFSHRSKNGLAVIAAQHDEHEHAIWLPWMGQIRASYPGPADVRQAKNLLQHYLKLTAAASVKLAAH